MGERGFGFLYVREDLQDTVVPTTRYGHRQIANFDRVGITWEAVARARRDTRPARSRTRWRSAPTRRSQYIEQLGLPNIRAHAQQLTDRLQKELPALGYASVTPKNNQTPIVAFTVKDVEATAKKLREGTGHGDDHRK